jgi:hypothetical protein
MDKNVQQFAVRRDGGVVNLTVVLISIPQPEGQVFQLRFDIKDTQQLWRELGSAIRTHQRELKT